MKKELVAILKLKHRLQQSNTAIKTHPDFESSAWLKYEHKQNTALIEAVDKAFGKRIDRGIQKELDIKC